MDRLAWIRRYIYIYTCNNYAKISFHGAPFNCFSGDHRVNVVPSLTAYHNLFVFEHNRIATQLSTIYSDPEKLFQETRRIVIAIMQKVVYDEFLPSFLSPETMKKFELSSNARYRYAATIDPTVSNAFGIAYRFVNHLLCVQ